MKLQLLLLAAIAALTVGAVSWAGQTSTASLSTVPSGRLSASPEASPEPAAATPATAAVTTGSEPASAVVEATVEAPAALPGAVTTPAACAAALALVHPSKGRKGPARAVIASAIADCVGQLPAGIEFKSGESGSGHGGGDSGD